MIAVCYTFPVSAPALILPPGVVALAHHNFGDGPKPSERPLSVSAQAWNTEGNIDGAVLNYEPKLRKRGDAVDVLKLWPSMLRRAWPTGVCVAYGADTGINNPDWNTTPFNIALVLRKPRKVGERGPQEWARLGLDGYKRTEDTDLTKFRGRLAWKAERLTRFYDLTKTRGVWFVDVQDQFTRKKLAYSKPVVHGKEWIIAQIEACPKEADLCIFAGASNADARAVVDEAILKALGWAKERRDTWQGTGLSKPGTSSTSGASAG
jgi:hypothetical protein